MKTHPILPVMSVIATAAAQPRPLDENPGNVFLKGQDVAVQTSAAEAGKWICVDYDGKRIVEGTGEAKLGKLDVGYYEIWTLADDGSRKTRTTLAVLAPLKVPVPDDTPIALDTAAAWFFRDEKKPFGLKQAASLSALAGVKWTRDRLSWTETEPEKGRFIGESIYDKSAAAFSEQGLKVLQVFHDTPPWAGGRPKFFPDDLRDVYDYLKTMSARWKGKVEAWEPWNEGDTTNFGGHTGAEMMAYQRAAYHGIRAGNPDAIVCQNVFAQHRKTDVLENFIENVVDSSDKFHSNAPFDTFNFHHYVKPEEIPASYADMQAPAGGHPIWVTESYFHFRQGVKKSDLELTGEQREQRARFVTTNLVTALDREPSKFFTFVLPHYVEGGVLFGLLNEDGTPRSDYVALAAAGRLLAGAKASGALKGEPSAYTFRAEPDGELKQVVVMWSEKEDRPFPQTLAGYEKAYDFLGREIVPKRIGKDPVYLVLPFASKLDVEIPETIRPVETKPASPLVIQPVFPPDRLRLDNSSWFIRNGETIEVPLRVYHFGESRAQVSISLETDAALAGTLSGNTAAIDPLGRWDGTLSLKLSGAPIPARPMLLKITATSPGMDPCFSVVRINTSLAEVTPLGEKGIATALEEKNWRPSSSPGDLKLTVKDGKVEASAKLKGGDRWVYPWLPLPSGDRPDDSWDGISFTILSSTTPATYHAMLKEPGGATYSISLPDVPADGKPHRVTMLFDEFHWANYTPADANGKLDRAAIEAVAIGGNPKREDFSYSVSDIRWVRFAK